MIYEVREYLIFPNSNICKVVYSSRYYLLCFWWIVWSRLWMEAGPLSIWHYKIRYIPLDTSPKRW